MTQQQPAIIANAAKSEAEVPDIQSLIDRAQALSQKVDWWNTAMLWALAVAALAAVAVGFATWKVVTKAKQLGDVQDELTLALRGKVATLEIAAGSTAKDLLVLQKAADDAKAAQQRVEIDLSKQQEKTAKAELALLQLQQRLADREITPQQREKMLKVLRAAHPGHVVVQSLLSGGRESLKYGTEIAAIFRDASWVVTDPTGQGAFTHPVAGVFLVVSPDMDSSDLTELVIQALIAGDIAKSPVTISPETRRGNGVLEIWVATKGTTAN